MTIYTREQWATQFTQDDAQRANNEWGCNCGPGALAAAMDLTLDEVRAHMGDFESKRYTSPSMMKAAMASLDTRYKDRRGNERSTVADFPTDGLVRVQWGGPWTASGANPRWAYWHTHWIATRLIGPTMYVFDINGGLRDADDWTRVIVPLLLPEKGDGRWWPTHLWEIIR